jgi:hypothetical protein
VYGIFLILSLLPTAFAVAFEYSARGISSGRPWLMALFPLVMLVGSRFGLPAARLRSGIPLLLLCVVIVSAGALFCQDMAGLLGFLGVHNVIRFIAPVAIALMYVAFGVAMGGVRSPGNARHERTRMVGPVEYPRERLPR